MAEFSSGKNAINKKVTRKENWKHACQNRAKINKNFDWHIYSKRVVFKLNKNRKSNSNRF